MSGKKIAIIGAGVAGLSMGIYGQLRGYETVIYERHTIPGGLVTGWKRNGYTADGCIHWLVGARGDNQYREEWRKLGVIDGITYIQQDIFSEFVDQDGKKVTFWLDPEKFQEHLLTLAPEDEKTIRAMCKAIHTLSRLPMAMSGNKSLKSLLSMLPAFPIFGKYGRMTGSAFSAQFKNPLLARAFESIWFGDMGILFLLYTLAWGHRGVLGYPIGGSLALAKGMEKRYAELGGKLVCGTTVTEITTDEGKATGVMLDIGKKDSADYVVSAGDAHTAIYDLLGGKYRDDEIDGWWTKMKPFPPIVMATFGVNRSFVDEPKTITGMAMKIPTVEIAGTKQDTLSFHVYNFDETLAPEGKTVIQSILTTNWEYWETLSKNKEAYKAEKDAIAGTVIGLLEKRYPGISAQIEMTDIATPLTLVRYTGNWHGSFEGWLPTPETLMLSMRQTLPGLSNFYMIGHWVQPGGGLPSGMMSARGAMDMITKQEIGRSESLYY